MFCGDGNKLQIVFSSPKNRAKMIYLPTLSKIFDYVTNPNNNRFSTHNTACSRTIRFVSNPENLDKSLVYLCRTSTPDRFDCKCSRTADNSTYAPHTTIPSRVWAFGIGTTCLDTIIRHFRTPCTRVVSYVRLARFRTRGRRKCRAADRFGAGVLNIPTRRFPRRP